MTDADAAPDGKAGDDLQQAKQAKPKGKEKAEDKEAELSEEDQELKANLELMVERSRDADPGIAANALEARASLVLWAPRPLLLPAWACCLQHGFCVHHAVSDRLEQELGHGRVTSLKAAHYFSAPRSRDVAPCSLPTKRPIYSSKHCQHCGHPSGAVRRGTASPRVLS